jgi:hypothetical protein
MKAVPDPTGKRRPGAGRRGLAPGGLRGRNLLLETALLALLTAVLVLGVWLGVAYHD